MANYKNYAIGETSTGTLIISKLAHEINNSAISVNLQTIDTTVVNNSITHFCPFFDGELLDPADIAILDGLVAAHDGNTKEDDVITDTITVITNVDITNEQVKTRTINFNAGGKIVSIGSESDWQSEPL